VTADTQTADSRLAEAPPGERLTRNAAHQRDRRNRNRKTRPLRALLLAGAGYLALAVVLWWHVWTGHPTSTTTCGCGDSSLFTWFIEWPAYAIAHGLNPFYSTATGYPGGVNLPGNTSVLAIGVVLAPVTWVFGPIASMNVALTLAPALSALSMFALVRRWVAWSPAAFFAGLLYGFSPFVLMSLTDAHLMLGMAVIPPLIVLCLDELLFRRKRSPVRTGLVLGLLVTVQFFIGSEILIIMAVVVVIGLVVVAVWAAWRHPADLRQGLHHTIVGLGAAAVTGGVLLAYPVWFALAGPAHLSGLVWPRFYPAYGGTVAKQFVLPAPALSTGFFGSAMSRVVGGSQGPVLSSEYFGFGAVVVVVGGLVAWRHDRRMWLLAVMAAISAVLSLGANRHVFLPWQLAAHLPQLENISSSRFVLFTYLCVAGLLGLIVDHCHTAWPGRPAWTAGLVGTVVAAVAVVPVAVYLATALPFTTQPVLLPTWFRTVAPHLTGKPVLLVLPAPFAVSQSAMTWQAVNRMHYSMAGQGGPSGTILRAGREEPGQSALTNATFFFSFSQAITSPGAVATQRALHDWGVTMVVIPDQPNLPAYERIRSVPQAAALVSAATGQRPIHQADAWVWADVNRPSTWSPPSTSTINSCLAGLGYEGVKPTISATNCVVAGGSAGP
jgi:hypothetical protein